MKNTTLQEYWKEYLKGILNLKSRSNAQGWWKIISNEKTIEISNLVKIIQKRLDSLDIRNTSKNNAISYLKAFLNFLSRKTQQFYDFKTWKFYAEEVKTRRPFDNDEMKKLRKYLNEFNNPKFSNIFELLNWNGTRLRDFVQINWRLLKIKNYKIQYITSKTKKPCPFEVPEWLIHSFDLYGANYNYNTIQNLFNKFKKFVLIQDPNWKAPIHAHILRHCFGTRSTKKNGADATAILMGHSSTSMLLKTYITYSEDHQFELLRQANDETISNLEKQQLVNQLTMEKKINNELKQLLKANGIDYENKNNCQEMNYNERDTRFFHDKILEKVSYKSIL